MCRFLLVLASVALAFGAGSVASDTSAAAPQASPAQSEPIRVPALQVVRALMSAGRWGDARDILEHVEPGSDDERIERLFLLGMCEVRLRRLRDAATRFETILTMRPELTRVRLELARVYDALGRDEKARFHFRASLADELPSSVENAVEAYMDRIDARKRWSASLSVALVPETNPVRRTDRETVRIGGFPFRLDDDAREAPGTGWLATAGGQFSPVIGDNLHGVLAGSAAAKRYRRRDWNDTSVQADTGIARLFDRGSVSGGIRLARRWLGSSRHSSGVGPWARARLRASPDVRLDVALDATRLRHPSRPDMDGWTVGLRSGLDYGFSPSTTLRAEIDVERANAREDRSASRLAGLAFAVSHAFRGGLSVSPRISVHRRAYSGRSPLFQARRSDRRIRISVNLLHRALQWHGFAPYVGLVFERNRSNIPINDYRNRGAVLGVSRTF